MDLDTALAQLNPAQKAAVLYAGTPLLVLAGAGTGKTKVLTTKIAYAIKTLGIRPSEVMAVTFTRKAAQELKDRLAQLLDPSIDIEDLFVGTFHSISSRILRLHQALHCGEEPFSLIDPDDQRALIATIIDTIDGGQPTYFGRERDIMIRNALDEIERIKSAGAAIADLDDPFASWPDHVRQPSDEMKRILQQYDKHMRSAGTLDFADLINDVEVLFRKYPALAETWAKRFRLVIVDEYQDTNAAQDRWLRLFSPDGQNLACFGDDDQALYSWRGASSAFILGFRDRHPTARIMTLDTNYRSPPNIVQAASDLIRTNKIRLAKPTRSAKSQDGQITVLARQGNDEIADAVVNEAMSHKPDDVTVIVRTNAQAERISNALDRAGLVPYRFNPESDVSQELKGYLAWLKIVANMNDNAAALRLIGDAAGIEVGRSLLRQATLMGKSIFGYLDDRKASASSINPAIAEIADTRRRIRDGVDFMQSDEILDFVLAESGILRRIDALRPGPKARFLRQHIALKAVAAHEQNLAVIISSAQIDLVDKDDRPKDSVAVSTMHGMKGLECPVVIAPFWSAGDFPGPKDKGETADESVRLAFVTLTRATKRFVAIYDLQKGPSPYLVSMGALSG